MSALDENIKKTKELQSKYPKKLKLLVSEAAVDSLDIDVMMKADQEEFGNDDTNLARHLENHLAAGKEVAVLPVGKYKVMVFAAKGLLK